MDLKQDYAKENKNKVSRAFCSLPITFQTAINIFSLLKAAE